MTGRARGFFAEVGPRPLSLHVFIVGLMSAHTRGGGVDSQLHGEKCFKCFSHARSNGTWFKGLLGRRAVVCRLGMNVTPMPSYDVPLDFLNSPWAIEGAWDAS